MSSAPPPALLWSFNGSNVDSVTGLSPSLSTLNTSTQIAPTYVNGLYGQAIYLNNQNYVSGSPNCYVQYNSSPLTTLSTNNCSISFWVNLVSLTLPASTFRCIISFNESGSSQTAYYTYYIYNNAINYIVQGPTSPSPSPTPAYAGKWFHNTIIFSNVGSTSDNTYTTYFINGISISSSNIVRHNSTSKFSLLQLAQAAGGGNPIWGSIQDFRMYNQALSAQQILGIYQSQGIPPRLTMTLASGGLPIPAFLLSFEGTTNDVITGNPPANTGSVTFNANGKYRQSAVFYQATPASTPPTTFLYYNQSFILTWTFYTFTAWIKPLSTVSGQVFVSWKTGSDPAGSNTKYYGIQAISSSGLQIIAATGNYTIPGITFTQGTWFHFAVSVSFGSSPTVYINGQSFTTTIATDNGYVRGIGLASDANNGLNGPDSAYCEIDDVRAYSSTLTAAQIQTIYQSGGNLYGDRTVQPDLLWSFNGTNVDSVNGLIMNGTAAYAPALYGQGLSVSTSNFVANLPSTSNILTENGLTISFWSTITAGAGPSFQSGNKIVVVDLESDVNNTVGNSNKINLALGFFNGWKISYFYNDPGFGYREYDSPQVASINTWYHFCLVFGGKSDKKMYFYINGVIDGSGVSYTTDMSGTTAFNRILNLYATNNTYVINDLRVYNQALSAQQILGIYQSQGIPPALTMTPASGGYQTVQPSLLFSLNGTTNDSILGVQGVVMGNPQYVTGIYGRAFNFLNTQSVQAGNYITVTQTAVTFSNTVGFSMSFWINLSEVMKDTQYWGGLFSVGNLLGHLSITKGGPGNGVLLYFDTTGSSTNLSRVYVPPLVWNHLAIVVNSTTETIYLNGVSASTGTYVFGGTTPYLSGFTGPIYIGGYASGNGLTGSMQDFRMYNQALSAQQILGIYQSGGAPPRTTLTSG